MTQLPFFLIRVSIFYCKRLVQFSSLFIKPRLTAQPAANGWRTVCSIMHENEKLNLICVLLFTTAGLLRPVSTREGHSQSPSFGVSVLLGLISDFQMVSFLTQYDCHCFDFLCYIDSLFWEVKVRALWTGTANFSGCHSISFLYLFIAVGTVDLASHPWWGPSSIPILPVRRLIHNCLFAEYKTSKHRFLPLSAGRSDRISLWI